MDKIINVSLLKQPLNWIILPLMVILVGTAGHLTLSWLGHEPSTPTT